MRNLWMTIWLLQLPEIANTKKKDAIIWQPVRGVHPI